LSASFLRLVYAKQAVIFLSSPTALRLGEFTKVLAASFCLERSSHRGIAIDQEVVRGAAVGGAAVELCRVNNFHTRELTVIVEQFLVPLSTVTFPR
jgi:hypothetical protein